MQKRARSTLVTDRDREILAFAAEHRIVLAGQVQTLLGVSKPVAYHRLGGLETWGLLKYSRILHGQPGWYQITRPGLALIGSDLPVPRIDLRCYRHDIGVAWAWLAAARGAFGHVERMVSEREMRSRDAVAAAAERAGAERGEVGLDIDIQGEARSPFGVYLGGVGPRGQIRLHYPDLLLVGNRGERVAIELELSAKGGRRLETILAGYGAEPSIAAVLYLTEKPQIAREVTGAAARLGISDLIHIQPVAWDSPTPRAPTPTRGRPSRAIGPSSATNPPAPRRDGQEALTR
ncbi:MAG TPA: hypothetical protein VIJ20_03665 [Solirubrobacteraceae bacterium]